MQKTSLFLMALLYVAAGLNHFVHPNIYMGIMPPWLAWHRELVFVSGVCEVVLGLLLLPRRTRHFAAFGVVLLLLAVFPANIQMAIDYYHTNHPRLWVALLRLPLQAVLVWWAVRFTKAENKKAVV